MVSNKKLFASICMGKPSAVDAIRGQFGSEESMPWECSLLQSTASLMLLPILQYSWYLGPQGRGDMYMAIGRPETAA